MVPSAQNRFEPEKIDLGAMPEGMSEAEKNILRSRKADALGLTEFNEADKSQRLEMLLRNRSLRELVMGNQAKDVDLMQSQNPLSIAQELQGARKGNFFQKSVADVQRTNPNMAKWIENESWKVAADRAEMNNTRMYDEDIRHNKYIAQRKEAGWSDAWIEQGWKQEQAKSFVKDTSEQVGLNGIIDAIRKGFEEQGQRNFERTQFAQQHPVLGPLMGQSDDFLMMY